jgi:hypothetical protein
MPFELGDSLKSTCNWTFQSKGMNNLFCSKFYTTAIMTVMIIVLIMVIYPCKKNTPPWLLFKLGFYVFILSLGIIIMHDGVVLSTLKEKMGGRESETFIDNIHNNYKNIAFNDDSIVVSPNTIHVTGGNEYDRSYDDSGTSGKSGISNEDLFQHFGV